MNLARSAGLLAGCLERTVARPCQLADPHAIKDVVSLHLGKL